MDKKHNFETGEEIWRLSTNEIVAISAVTNTTITVEGVEYRATGNRATGSDSSFHRGPEQFQKIGDEYFAYQRGVQAKKRHEELDALYHKAYVFRPDKPWAGVLLSESDLAEKLRGYDKLEAFYGEILEVLQRYPGKRPDGGCNRDG